MGPVNEPLLGRARHPSSSAEHEAYDSAGRRKLSDRRSAVATGTNVEKAAALVDLAEDGIGLPPEVLHEADFAGTAARYLRYQSFGLLWNANLVLLILLNFLEVPAWCQGDLPHPCGDPKAYHLGEIPYLPPRYFSALELVALVVLAAQVFLPLTFLSWTSFWAVTKNQGWVVLFLLLALDVLRNAAGIFFSAPALTGMRLAPYLRVFLVVQSSNEVRKGMRFILGVIPGFLDMATLLFLYLIFVSWLAYILFEDTTQGEVTFTSFIETLYNMVIMVLTSANWPTVWMPAFNTERSTAFFFIPVYFIGTMFLMSLLLAVVYQNYKVQLKAEYEQELLTRSSMLTTAFKLLDRERKGSLSVDQVSALLAALNKYRSLPPYSEDEIRHIIISLDDSGDQAIQEDEFQDLCTAIQLKFVRTDEPTFLEIYFPRFTHSQRYRDLKKLVNSEAMEKALYVILVINAVIIIVEAYFDTRDKSHTQQIWLNVEMIFGWVYLVELLLKLAGMGFTNYWRVHSNRFDGLVTLFVVAAQVLILAGAIDKEWIRYVLIACILRLSTLLALVKRYHVIMMTFFNLIPVLTPVLLVTYCFISLFASMGIWLFGGKVYDGAPWLQGFGYEPYMGNNFNDFASAIVLVSHWLFSGLFFQWMEIGVLILGTPWIRLWFYLFLLLGNMFIMNIFIGFVLEAYYTELELNEKGGAETRELRLSGAELGTNVQVIHNNRFDRLMAHMLGKEDIKQKHLEQSRSGKEASDM